MANTTITREEYITQLKEYITSEMTKLEHNHESVSFWAQFNRDKKIEFDTQLAEKGITITE